MFGSVSDIPSDWPRGGGWRCLLLFASYSSCKLSDCVTFTNQLSLCNMFAFSADSVMPSLSTVKASPGDNISSSGNKTHDGVVKA